MIEWPPGPPLDSASLPGLREFVRRAVAVDESDASVVDVPTALLAVAAFLALNRWHGKLTIVAAVLSCGLAGVALQATGVV
jgi:hypothetical protein